MPSSPCHPALVKALVEALEHHLLFKKSKSLPDEKVYFHFGMYGQGTIEYTHQPKIDGLISCYDLLTHILPVLAKDKKPTMLRAAFAQVIKKPKRIFAEQHEPS